MTATGVRGTAKSQAVRERGDGWPHATLQVAGFSWPGREHTARSAARGLVGGGPDARRSLLVMSKGSSLCHGGAVPNTTGHRLRPAACELLGALRPTAAQTLQCGVAAGGRPFLQQGAMGISGYSPNGGHLLISGRAHASSGTVGWRAEGRPASQIALWPPTPASAPPSGVAGVAGVVWHCLVWHWKRASPRCSAATRVHTRPGAPPQRQTPRRIALSGDDAPAPAPAPAPARPAALLPGVRVPRCPPARSTQNATAGAVEALDRLACSTLGSHSSRESRDAALFRRRRSQASWLPRAAEAGRRGSAISRSTPGRCD
ncbi:hypothetical protein C7974DRAFT_440401 [Boeremia exigua]|uniref:uncharacterized protein n=1 Tax=Boeremia exigua TaxID=749465 RepID=UPI001E8E4A73|nr:uncharacterized protein C7974DRAFT_440401 [Boeremia exigua]KAH6644808.1 hypothetical protein C7974DRAFT_440401 [Boeremia exigua]